MTNEHPGTLCVTGPAQERVAIEQTLRMLYGDITMPHEADWLISYAINAPFPSTAQADTLQILEAYDCSGYWFPWNDDQPYNYVAERHVFGIGE